MANSKITEGVGKKIVEALKKQSEIEINPISEEKTEANFFEENNFLEDFSTTESLEEEHYAQAEPFIQEEPITFEEVPFSHLDEHFQQHPQHAETQNSAFFGGYQQPASMTEDSFAKELDTFEIPSNIAALKKLVSQLPTGVTRQTGAQIIRQTMEALGIPMKGVLQEAQQVQDGISNSARECQNTIQEYKKQIITLEKQNQQYQRQYAALNDLISLFIQTGR